ncbi:PLP-dependent aspartate aminotransferase family protein [Ornithinimicrobium sp. F0845]|uniref:trans-sulfuration enzyme family protein n=1 Tax=Ornithinimicrobium sp. F0845 TaxID=2926412 RepID=UPI001FF1CC46|nr:PLP-dependent aspartate aminotransferase family protein [Ornithinimicrobium sp. F0845]MCK0112883.1 PLP-dependent aspartate aminotransferase family protein [Ornithinimicrobium sp. F0845]
MDPHDDLTPATRAVALGRPEREPGEAVAPPVTFTSTYVAGGSVTYARVGNPTWTALEEVLGGLEGGDALVFASGLAAIDAVLTLVPPGGRVIAPGHAYNGTTGLLREASAEGRLEVVTLDISDTDAVVSALDGMAGGRDLLYIESPTNPMMEVADIPVLVREARARGILTAVDNTFATPLLQTPLADGVDLVVHSATKYLSGHSDVLMGAVVTAPTEQGRALRERILTRRSLHGAIPGPMEAWIVLRGIRTLAVRLERASENARVLVERLEAHDAVSRVRYPGVGAMVSIEVGDGPDAADRVCAATRLWTHSTSLGGVESQLERRRAQPLEVETVPESLIRLSVGIEDVEDLWRDLSRALDQA